jgi:hypothetical protein
MSHRTYLVSKEKGSPSLVLRLKEDLPPVAYNQVRKADDGTKSVVVSAANTKHAKLIGKRLMRVRAQR